MKVCVLGAGGFIGKNLIRNTDWVLMLRRMSPFSITALPPNF